MKQVELNRAVARATGETMDVVARMGFQEIVTPVVRRATPVSCQLQRKLRLALRRAQQKPALAA